MTIDFSAVFWLVAMATAAPHQDQQITEAKSTKVYFCELIRHPELYDGKTVIFSAIYGGSIEGAVFVDEGCGKKTAEDDVIALATFSSTNYKRIPSLDKKFNKLIKRTGSVQLTVVGLFTDGKKRVFGHLNCCRYKIEIQELIAVEQLKAGGTS
jgi:hypothetical protein